MATGKGYSRVRAQSTLTTNPVSDLYADDVSIDKARDLPCGRLVVGTHVSMFEQAARRGAGHPHARVVLLRDHQHEFFLEAHTELGAPSITLTLVQPWYGCCFPSMEVSMDIGTDDSAPLEGGSQQWDVIIEAMRPDTDIDLTQWYVLTMKRVQKQLQGLCDQMDDVEFVCHGDGTKSICLWIKQGMTREEMIDAAVLLIRRNENEAALHALQKSCEAMSLQWLRELALPTSTEEISVFVDMKIMQARCTTTLAAENPDHPEYTTQAAARLYLKAAQAAEDLSTLSDLKDAWLGFCKLATTKPVAEMALDTFNQSGYTDTEWGAELVALLEARCSDKKRKQQEMEEEVLTERVRRLYTRVPRGRLPGGVAPNSEEVVRAHRGRSWRMWQKLVERYGQVVVDWAKKIEIDLTPIDMSEEPPAVTIRPPGSPSRRSGLEEQERM